MAWATNPLALCAHSSASWKDWEEAAAGKRIRANALEHLPKRHAHSREEVKPYDVCGWSPVIYQRKRHRKRARLSKDWSRASTCMVCTKLPTGLSQEIPKYDHKSKRTNRQPRERHPLPGRTNNNPSNSIKLLGMHLDRNMDFNEHIGEACRKASVRIGVLFRLWNLVPCASKHLLYKTAHSLTWHTVTSYGTSAAHRTAGNSNALRNAHWEPFIDPVKKLTLNYSDEQNYQPSKTGGCKT